MGKCDKCELEYTVHPWPFECEQHAAATVEDEALDQIIIDNASDKTDKGLKSFAVRNGDIKANDAYMKAVVSGKKLKELEDAGKITKDPSTEKYL